MRIPIITPFAALTLIALSVISAETHAGLPITNIKLHIAVPVAVAFATAQWGCRVSVTSCFTVFAVTSGGPILTLVADAWSL